MGQLECHLREHEDEENRHTVHHVEEDELGDQEIATISVARILGGARNAVCAEEGVVGENVGNEAENGVDGGPLVKDDQEFTTHASGSEENDCANPFNDMEQSHEEESLVINPCGVQLVLQPLHFIALVITLCPTVDCAGLKRGVPLLVGTQLWNKFPSV